MPGVDVSALSPGDAIVALRSYPRRYTAALAPLPDDPDSSEALVHRVGPAGVSAFDLLTDTVRTVAVIANALHQVLVTDAPVLHPAVADPAHRHWEQPPVGATADLLAELVDEVTSLADDAARVKGETWTRSGVVAGSDPGPVTPSSITAANLVREAVRTAADNLRGIDAALAAARRR